MPVDRHLFPRAVSFQQTVHRVLVECLHTNVDLNGRGSVVEVQNGYAKDLRKFDTTPTLDAAAAAAAAGAEVHRRQPTLKIAGVQPRSLVIDVCGQAQPHLRYDGFVRLDVGDAGAQQELYFVDGRSGAVTLYPPSPLARE